MKFWKAERITPARIIILGFLAMILTGTLLLMLPMAGSRLREATWGRRKRTINRFGHSPLCAGLCGRNDALCHQR